MDGRAGIRRNLDALPADARTKHPGCSCLCWRETPRHDRSDYCSGGFHPGAVDGRTIAWRACPPKCSRCCGSKYSGRTFCCAAGLLIATGIRRLPPHRARPTALLFAGLAFVGMVFVKLPLLVVLLALALLSVAATAVGNTRT